MLSLIGFLLISFIIYFLVSAKMTPFVAFIVFSLIAIIVLALYYQFTGQDFVFYSIVGKTPTVTHVISNPLLNFKEFFTAIIDLLTTGIGKTTSTALLFIFSIFYFAMMNDLGLFNPLIEFIHKSTKDNIVLICVLTAILATIAHLNGSMPATLLITVPSMYPIFKSMRMRPVILLIIIAAAVSTMNLSPWGGPVARAATVVDVNVLDLWHQVIPIQLLGIPLILVFAALLGVFETVRIKKVNAITSALTKTVTSTEATTTTEPSNNLKSNKPKFFIFNLLITIIVLIILFICRIQPYLVFMIASAFVLLINYPSQKTQNSVIKKHAPHVLNIACILLASGIFLGTMIGTGILVDLANTFISIIPAFLGKNLNVLMGILAIPLGMVLGTDAYFFGLVPLAMQVGQEFNIDTMDMAKTMLIGKNFAILLTPHAASTFLAMELTGVSLKELLKTGIPLLWPLSLVSLLFAHFLGVI